MLRFLIQWLIVELNNVGFNTPINYPVEYNLKAIIITDFFKIHCMDLITRCLSHFKMISWPLQGINKVDI